MVGKEEPEVSALHLPERLRPGRLRRLRHRQELGPRPEERLPHEEPRLGASGRNDLCESDLARRSDAGGAKEEEGRPRHDRLEERREQAGDLQGLGWPGLLPEPPALPVTSLDGEPAFLGGDEVDLADREL